MKKKVLIFTILLTSHFGTFFAQQDPQFTQFMYNKLVYNPGYAGTSGGMCGVIQYRQQWASFTGAPVSMALGLNAAVPNVPLGVGLTVITDQIGPMKTTFLRAAGSYNLKLAAGTLGLGIDFGFLQKTITDKWIAPEPLKVDSKIPGAYGSYNLDNKELDKLTFDLGFGAFYQLPDKFYIGVSSTHLPAQTIKGSGSLQYALSRHYYVMSGFDINIVGWHKITPNVFLKSDGASTSIDANLTYMWSDMIWLGATYRSSNATAILVGYQQAFGSGNAGKFKIGYSYDFTTSELNQYATHEVILSLCLAQKSKKRATYGNDRFLR